MGGGGGLKLASERESMIMDSQYGFFFIEEEIDGLWTSLKATATYFYQKKHQAKATSTQSPKMNVKNNC